MITFATLGAADITPTALVHPSQEHPGVAVTHIAARERTRAETFARKYAIPHILDDYAAIVEAPVDAIYVPLPPSGHAEWSIRSLQAGKHVLCEKPFARSAAEATRMVEAANTSGCILMEAFHYRYHPFFDRVLALLATGALGEITSLEALFCAPVKDRANFRWKSGTGAGAMMDLGCYPLHWARTLLGTEPTVLRASAQADRFGTDASMHAELLFPGDIVTRIHCDMSGSTKFRAALRIVGSQGSLSVENPLAPHLGNRLVLETDTDKREESIPGQTTYAHQLEAFYRSCSGDQTAQRTGGSDSIANMKAIDAIYAHAGLPPRDA